MAPAQASELAQQLAKWNSAPQEPWHDRVTWVTLVKLTEVVYKISFVRFILCVERIVWGCLRSLFMGSFYIPPLLNWVKPKRSSCFIVESNDWTASSWQDHSGRPKLSCFWLLLCFVVTSTTVDLQEWEFEQVNWYGQDRHHFLCVKNPSCSWSFSHLALEHVLLVWKAKVSQHVQIWYEKQCKRNHQ